METVKFSGSSDAKGRNGYFRLDSASACVLPDGNESYRLNIEIQSKRNGNAAPIVMSLTHEDANNLAAFLANATHRFESEVSEVKARHDEARAYHQARLLEQQSKA